MSETKNNCIKNPNKSRNPYDLFIILKQLADNYYMNSLKDNEIMDSNQVYVTKSKEEKKEGPGQR